MAVSAGMALLSTAVTAATGPAAVFGFGSVLTFLSPMLSHFVVTTALGAAIRALTPRPSGGNTGYKVTQIGSAVDHQVIYGKTKVGGVRIFDSTTGNNNKYLHRILAFAGHEVESFHEIYINDEVVTLDGTGNVTSPTKYDGVVRIKEHLGSTTQTADTDLVSESDDWTSDHRLQGVAYLYVRLSYDADVFPNGVPEISAVIKGKKVYDPRDSSTAWSDNGALCVRDYLTNSQYGLGESSDSIDDSLVITSANVCDEVDTLDSSTRYTCNGAFTTASTPYDTLRNMMTSMAGLLWYAQGKWRMKPAYWTTPAISFDEDDLRSNISISTRHSRRDNFNTVKGVFRGEESNWQATDFPPITNASFLSADNQQESVVDLELPFTDTSVESRRIARIFLERNRQQLSVQASFGMSAFQVQVGDNVYLTNTRFGWTSKAFEVTAWTFGAVDTYDLQIQLTLREISESVFDEVDDGEVYERDNTELLSPFDVPTVGISTAAVAKIISEKLLNTLEVTITSAQSERIDLVEVQYRTTGSGDDYASVGIGELGKFSIIDLERDSYDIRARAINTFGVKGAWEYSLNVPVDALSAPPADVTNFEHELSGGSVFLSWTPVADLDLSYYEIRHSPLTSGATWSTASVAVNKVARPGTHASLPARSGTFFIKAWDKGGNPSDAAVSTVILPAELPPLGTTQTQTEHSTFSGTKTNVVVDTSPTPDELIIDVLTGTPAGTYEFSTYIDTGSSRTCRVTGIVTFNRHQAYASLWDSLPQNWDTWPDNWDTWTDEDADFGDHTVLIYAAATDDDPSASPTWGAWQLATGSEIVGRAFKFKAELSSTNTDVSPSIETLEATVEY